MIKEALEYLLDLRRPSTIGFDGVAFTTEKLVPPPATHPLPVGLSTLTSLVSFVAENRDELELAELTAVVDSPTQVSLLGPPDTYGRRPEFAEVNATLPKIALNQFVERQAFHIALLSCFVQTAQRDELLKLVGNVEGGELRTVQDDGVSQQVVVAANLASKVREVVRPLFSLAPFSTFAELEQVERPFIFRLLDKDGAVYCGLFEADGGAWQNEARKRVAAFLTNGLKPSNVVTLW